MTYDETPLTKSSGVNILDRTRGLVGCGALVHSFQMGRTFQKADNTPDTQLTEKHVCNKDCSSAAIRDNNYIIHYRDRE